LLKINASVNIIYNKNNKFEHYDPEI
jgi:hypothetical protein